MKVTYDKQADAMYLYLSHGKVKKTVPVNDRVVVDVGDSGNVVGVELLFVSQGIPKAAFRSRIVRMSASAR